MWGGRVHAKKPTGPTSASVPPVVRPRSRDEEHFTESSPPTTPRRTFAFSDIPLYSPEERGALDELESSRSAGTHVDAETAGFLSLRFGSLQDAQRAASPRRASPSFPLQARLEVGAVDDPLEAEADRVADRVMAAGVPDGVSEVRGGSPAPASDVVQRACATCDEQEDEIRRAPGGSNAGTPPVPSSVANVLASPGAPLDSATRAFMEPRFGHGFGHVRVHDGPLASESAAGVGARAYTVGSHLVFRSGAYAPTTTDGRRLLAHELTHVVQQDGAEPARIRRKADQALAWWHMRGPSVLEAKRGLNRYHEQERAAGRPGFGSDWKPLTDDDYLDDRVPPALGTFQRQRKLRHRDQRVWQETLDALRETSPATPAPAPETQPRASETSEVLQPTQDAVSGIHLEFMAGPLPRTEGTVDRFNFRSGPYKLVPNLRDRSGSPKVAYYVAYRTDAKRNEYIIGPDSLQLFTAKLNAFKSIGDTAYADPDVIDYIIGFGDAVWDQQGDIVTQYMRWLGLHDIEAFHAAMVQEGKRLRDEQRTRQQREAKATMAAKVLPLINAAMVAAAGARLLAGGRVLPASGGAPPAPGIDTPAPGVDTPAPGAKTPPPTTETPTPAAAGRSEETPSTATADKASEGRAPTKDVEPVPATSGADIGREMAKEMRASAYRGNPFREFQRRLNARPVRLSPKEAAEAIRVAAADFTANTQGTMPAVQRGDVLVVPSRAEIPNAPVMGIQSDGTVMLGRVERIEIVRDAKGIPLFPLKIVLHGNIVWESL